MKKLTIIIIMLILFTAVVFAQEDVQMSAAQQKLYQLGFDIPKSALESVDFTAPDITGDEVSLSSLKGKLIMLNLWATWCPPCQKEMPSMQRLSDKMKGKNFTILAVGTPSPPRETKDKILSYIKRNKYTFPVLVDESQQVYGIYGSGSIPTTWLIGPDGTILARLVGAREWDSDELIEIFNSIIE